MGWSIKTLTAAFPWPPARQWVYWGSLLCTYQIQQGDQEFYLPKPSRANWKSLLDNVAGIGGEDGESIINSPQALKIMWPSFVKVPLTDYTYLDTKVWRESRLSQLLAPGSMNFMRSKEVMTSRWVHKSLIGAHCTKKWYLMPPC